MNSKDYNNTNKWYVSTRSDKRVSASEAIVKGLSEDGGLYVPEFLDQVHFDLEKLKDLDYVDLTVEILRAFLTDFTIEQIQDCVRNAYMTGKFDVSELVNVVEAGNTYYTELWHGPTAAFKDMALTLLPHLLTCAMQNTDEDKKVVILTATSGDTGKAALEGFKDVDNTEIITFYPKDGVSPAQERQMITTGGKNTHVISVEGNFDDAQSGVKEIFNDRAFNQFLLDNDFILSSANSINIGRLLPQIVYYYYSYFELVREGVIDLGEKIDFIVPSGNFGDILAGYYAKESGLPVNKLICASNINKILTDFFETGIYDTNRDFYKTSSPSMDILISSNLERLLYDKLGHDPVLIKALMDELAQNGSFNVRLADFNDFIGGFATEEEVFDKIKSVFLEDNYLIDPHTAVGGVVREKNRGTTPAVVLSTANPYKFSKNVYKSIYGEPEKDVSEFELQRELSDKTGESIPEPLRGLEEREVLHDMKTGREKMREAVLKALKLGVNDEV